VDVTSVCGCSARLAKSGGPMFPNLIVRSQARRVSCLAAILLPLALVSLRAPQAAAQQAARDAPWKKLEPFPEPPAEFADKFGSYPSPLKFADGAVAKTPADWTRRRAEILKTWHERLGTWPPLVERPIVKRLESVEREGYTEHRVSVQISPDGKTVE